jgi:hypothetical protein
MGEIQILQQLRKQLIPKLRSDVLLPSTQISRYVKRSAEKDKLTFDLVNHPKKPFNPHDIIFLSKISPSEFLDIQRWETLNLEDNMSSLLAVSVLVVHHSSLADFDEKPTYYSNQIFNGQMKCAMSKSKNEQLSLFQRDKGESPLVQS